MNNSATNYYKQLSGGYGVVSAISYNGFTIEKYVNGYAYPRNGNAHNPTPRIRWIVRDAAGINQGSAPSLAKAKAIVTEVAK